MAATPRASASRFMPARAFKELTWLAPFVCVGLITLAPLRPPPVLPPFAQSRIVTDAEGVNVAVPTPFRAIADHGGSNFLETTHAPEMLFKGGGAWDRDFWFASGLMARIYPQVLKDADRWNAPSDLESLLAYEDSATFLSPFMFGNRAEPLMRRIGLAALSLSSHPKTKDESIFTAIRIEAEAMANESQGESFITGYQKAYADLKKDLRPEALTHVPRVVGMGSSASDWSRLFVFGSKETRFHHQYERAGVENATEPYEDTGRQQDAERILAMNPDIIFLVLESVQDFHRDPRWQGLKAVQNDRVYNGLRSVRGSVEPLHGLDFRPLWARWMAEIAHPDRLQPKVRALLRDHFNEAYGYALSDAEVDDLLRIDENKNSAGYARFTRDNIKSTRQEATQ
ncbi:ABC transporter substrate-binding protein [Methyloferula stellata]|uniref:ABC transporter substrate-binding protein n=1 Tax=Methyloferula stellata TaxID=876270 RepID=UPI000370A6A8|nr:ABC transporter substrate-binding protein [Methyloferula stellata]